MEQLSERVITTRKQMIDSVRKMNQQHPLDPSAQRLYDRGQGLGETQHLGQGSGGGGGDTER